jgi:hypothetical protein
MDTWKQPQPFHNILMTFYNIRKITWNTHFNERANARAIERLPVTYYTMLYLYCIRRPAGRPAWWGVYRYRYTHTYKPPEIL